MFRPIIAWPGELTKARVPSPFTADWRQTLGTLEKEIDALNGKNLICQIALTELDFTLDQRPYAGARPEHPGVVIAFESKQGPLAFACDRFNDWHDNVRAVALGLESLRRVDRYGISRRGEQYTGYKALPAPPSAMSPREADRLLREHGGYRAAVRATHPDKGGDPEQFRRITAAKSVLEKAGAPVP